LALPFGEHHRYQHPHRHTFRERGDKIISYASPQQRGGQSASVASHLLEGSLRFDGDLVRTAVRLIDATSAAIVWSGQQDRQGKPGHPAAGKPGAEHLRRLNDYFCHG
jgi:hypothetical protein